MINTDFYSKLGFVAFFGEGGLADYVEKPCSLSDYIKRLCKKYEIESFELIGDVNCCDYFIEPLTDEMPEREKQEDEDDYVVRIKANEGQRACLVTL